jgi:hypothetical protein
MRLRRNLSAQCRRPGRPQEPLIGRVAPPRGSCRPPAPLLRSHAAPSPLSACGSSQRGRSDTRDRRADTDDIPRTRLRPPSRNHEAGHRAPPSVDPLDTRRIQGGERGGSLSRGSNRCPPRSRWYFRLREGPRVKVGDDVGATDVGLPQPLDLHDRKVTHDRLRGCASDAELEPESLRVDVRAGRGALASEIGARGPGDRTG